MNLYRTGLETNTSPRWEDLPQQLRDNLHKAELICQGCKTDVLFEGCKRCTIRACAKEKKVEGCVECAEYPCQEVKKRTGYISEVMRDVLPHTKVMFRNIDVIKEKGLDYWVKDQERRWSCPQCGAPFTWYQETCNKCGRELGSIKDYNNY
jgi:predicted amidophosphoribosyltransferase